MAEKIVIAIASDLSGFPLKREVVKHLRDNHPDIEVLDFGIESEDAPQPYYIQASKVAKAIQDGRAQKGIAICGTGQGMAIVCNKHKGVYACVADDIFSGERGKIINNANVITMGGWITGTFPRLPDRRRMALGPIHAEDGVQARIPHQCLQQRPEDRRGAV